MIPPLTDFVEGLVACLKPGGMMVVTSVQPNSMHSLQCTRLGRNAYAYIAHAYGLELVDYFKRPENSYGVAIFHKPTEPQAPTHAEFHDEAYELPTDLRQRFRSVETAFSNAPQSAF